MKRLWWRFLDRLFPKYQVGYDAPYYVVMQKKRDGTLWLRSHGSHGEDGS